MTAVAIVAPFARIGLRILAGYLAGWGMTTEDAELLATDPELLAVAILVMTEGWYLMARWLGWSK